MRSFHHLLMKAHTSLHKKVMADAAAYALTAGQPKILEFLAQAGSADQKTIAEHCEIEPATVGSILTRMEGVGLVERRRLQENRRSVLVSLTLSGEQAARDTQKIFEKNEEAALSGFTEAERETLCSLLERVYLNLRLKEI